MNFSVGEVNRELDQNGGRLPNTILLLLHTTKSVVVVGWGNSIRNTFLVAHWRVFKQFHIGVLTWNVLRYASLLEL